VTDPDDRLMARLRAGDPAALDELYARYQGPLFGVLRRLTGDRALAEDLLQETFLRVWRARDRYAAAGRFRAWLFTIAYRLAADHARRAAGTETALPEDLPAPERPDERAAAGELAARLEQVIARLPPTERAALLLSRCGGLDAAEIAQATGSTPGAVRVALHRALRRVAAALGERR